MERSSVQVSQTSSFLASVIASNKKDSKVCSNKTNTGSWVCGNKALIDRLKDSDM